VLPCVSPAIDRPRSHAYDAMVRSLRFKSTVSAATFAAAQLVRVLPRVPLSRMVGRLCEQRLPAVVSRAMTSLYSRAYGVDLSEVEAEAVPYRSFDDFFTRPLRPGARVIEEVPLISPADGRLDQTGKITSGAVVWVKGQGYDVGELLGDPSDASRYSGGTFAVIYLSPRDYHRVHSPVDGTLRLVRGVAGDSFPVNAVGQRIARLLVRNRRVAIPIDTLTHGRVTVVMVGAINVGRISVTALGVRQVDAGTHALQPAVSLHRGDELGVFHLGSTVVVLVEPGLPVTRGLGPIRWGQALVKAP
jgi:phosphatidylserine decarboxylase